jgi:hypothetical protein
VDPIKLAALDQPIAPVELPNGRVAQVWPVNALARRLMRDNAAAPTDERNRAIIKLLIRDITDEELDSLSDVMTLYVIGIAADKVAMAEELIEEARKNVSAGTTDLGSRTRPSSPTTTSPTLRPRRQSLRIRQLLGRQSGQALLARSHPRARRARRSRAD